MKRLTLLMLIIGFGFQGFGQPSGLLGETFNLEYLDLHIFDIQYTPNDENPRLIFSDNGTITFETFGIENTISGEAVFNGNTVELKNMMVSSPNCNGENCYFEEMYFYEFLTNLSLQDQTFTFFYSVDSNGTKHLTFRNSTNEWARFSNLPRPEPDPRLFQTWYLFRKDFDLGDPIYYTGPDQPQLTINPDFTYTGFEGCASIEGEFILGNPDWWDFVLQSQNYNADESNCPPGGPALGYWMYELAITHPLQASIYEGSNGIDYFYYEDYPGFISHFRNVEILSTNEYDLNIIVLYPNPATDKIWLAGYGKPIDELRIFNVHGVLLEEKSQFETGRIDISNLSAGVYFVHIKSSEGQLVKRFVKM